jgi:protein-S-isoprenylcysteine O-methyltransferase Ste14
MMKKLVLPTLRTVVIGLLVFGVLLFLPAGTFNFWRGWVFIAVFSISTNAIGIYLLLKDPALLERRLQAGPAAEQRPVQKIIISLALLTFIAMLVFCAFDYRFGWSPVPAVVSIIGDGLVALGLFVDLLVFRENSYGASNIRVEEKQKVITSGPYTLVRHPMYSGVLIMVLGIAPALGSWWGMAFLLITLPVLALRILDEEKALHEELAGYPEYEQKVRYRLVPYVW